MIQSLAGLLNLFEMAYAAEGRSKPMFSIVLRKKFIQKADRFPFLDPFSGEFTYNAGKLSLKGAHRPVEVAKGVVDSMLELGKELGIMDGARPGMKDWLRKHADEYSALGIRFPSGVWN